jgi:hypothetical protein
VIHRLEKGIVGRSAQHFGVTMNRAAPALRFPALVRVNGQIPLAVGAARAGSSEVANAMAPGNVAV